MSQMLEDEARRESQTARPAMLAVVLALAVLAGGCRGRTPAAPKIDWKAGAGHPAEAAAVLLLGPDGSAKVVCLPGGPAAGRPFSTTTLQRIWDVAWGSTPLLAGGTGAETATADLVLLPEQGSPRQVATGIRSARFSPDGAALAYQLAYAADGTALPYPSSHVLDLASGKVTDLGPLCDPRWGPDGKYVYATRVRVAAKDGAGEPGHWRSLRVRWERRTGTVTVDGPGSAQLPAPRGDGVAWSERQRGAPPAPICSIVLRREGGVRHSVVGSFCAGNADDRAVRWSDDGRWLAFAHPGPVPGRHDRAGFFVDVVGIGGGRYPALTALHGRTPPDRLAIATGPGPLWFDWSPSGRFLVLQDGRDALRVYDFQALGTADLGEGREPKWSPGGSYLLLLAGSPTRALALAGADPRDRSDLGPARDARWLPPEACGRH